MIQGGKVKLMKPFTQIVRPHDDILEGRLTMDVFAADLWQVAFGNAPPEYRNPELFFRKTYLTKGLKNLIEVAKNRLLGKTGDAVVQLQTPFGGGKTHALIALYHRAREWNAKVLVFDGTALSAEVRLWEEFERQLTGKIDIARGEAPPGKEKLIKLISENSPLLILMDEVLQYITKASAIKVGDSNLGAQTLAFLQELMSAVASVGNAMLVITLPSSVLEHYDENAERAFQQLQKIAGRMEKIYNPVEDDEIEQVVRARLFSWVDEKEVGIAVEEFIDYAKRENLLTNDEISTYRERFLKSFPFKPEVIDVLYKRWGSFPTFQRTRGVLRLLSLVIHNLVDKNVPFIRLADFDLNNDEVRRELIKHIGQEWDSVVAQDITSNDSGSKKVDKSLGASYSAYRLGTAVATTIFMTSFSGRGEKGVNVREIKLSVCYPEFPSNVVDTVINGIREKLFYLSDEGFYFTNQPNLNRIIVTREENVTEEKIYEEELKILKDALKKASRFKIIIHSKSSRDIPDTEDLKLVILKEEKPEQEFVERNGETPRVYRNTLIFLCRDKGYEEHFSRFLRTLIALRSLKDDKMLRLTDSQKKVLQEKLKDFENRIYEELRRLYRRLYLPKKDGFREIDLGIPSYGEKELESEIFERLKGEGEIIEKISAKLLKDRFLKGDYLEISKLYRAFLKTPGELRVLTKEGFIEGVKEGVKAGLFGFGYLTGEKLEFVAIKKEPKVELREEEIIIKPELFVEQKEQKITEKPKEGKEKEEREPVKKEIREETIKSIEYRLKVPPTKISDVVKLVYFLKGKFSSFEIEVSLKASDGELSKSELEDKVKEALRQSGIAVEEEKVE
ncbi:MAG: hypothetical protein QXD49_00485 [Archaeoglobaceae archaeon]